MGFYSKYILPRLIESAMSQQTLAPIRERVVGAAHGRVLEIGIGSGMNLDSYRDAVQSVYGIDPSVPLLDKARERAQSRKFEVKLLEAGSEELPFEKHSFDRIVMTFTLCSIPGTTAALGEMRRVLKPGGELLFAEHGRAPELPVARWQDWLTPVWKRIGGGCHLNRKIDGLIESAGFRFEQLEVRYMSGPRPFAFVYEGCARPM